MTKDWGYPVGLTHKCYEAYYPKGHAPREHFDNPDL